MTRAVTLSLLAIAVSCFAAGQARAAVGNVSPTKANGDFISGTGIPADNFNIDTAPTGESVALKARQRVDGEPISMSGNHYVVPAGLAPSSSNPAWSFDFQFSPSSTASPSNPPNYLLTLTVDFDPAVGVTSPTSISLPIFPISGGPSWFTSTDGGFFNPQNGGWSDGTPYVVANSYHLGFSFWTLLGASPPYDPFATGEYEIDLAVNDLAGAPIASTTVFADVTAVPEPSTIIVWSVLGAVFGGTACWRRRKLAA